jgi:hypothetical protein
MRHFLAIAFAMLGVTASAQKLTTPTQVITAMHDRYAANWYHTLTFQQQSITHKPDGTSSTDVWHEAMLSPGRLRIDFGDSSTGNGALFVNGHEYIYQDGKLVKDLDRLNHCWFWVSMFTASRWKLQWRRWRNCILTPR